MPLLALGAGCDEAEGDAEASPGTGSHAGEGGSAAASAAGGSNAPPPQHEPSVDAAAFADGAFVLRVTRRWNGEPSDVALPGMALDEDDYQVVEPADRYEVVVSQELDHVTITPETEPAIEGTLAQGTAGALSYELDAFAGGRFVIWTSGGGLEAELTLYGSGVPIVSSERGELIAEP